MPLTRLLFAVTLASAVVACSPAPDSARRSPRTNDADTSIVAPSSSGAAVPDTAAVLLDSIWREGDKLAIEYRVALGPAWQGKMEALLLQPGVPLERVLSSGPDFWLDRKATYAGRDVVEWTIYDPAVPPIAGQAVGGFVMKTRAVLGDISFLVERYEPPALTSEDQLGDSVRVTPIWEQGISGTVLGPITTLPPTPTDRAAQLATDLAGWCGANSTMPREVCESLSDKTAAVQAAAETPELTQRVRVLRAELDAQRTKFLAESVYWRLVADLLMIAP